jgi:hypothetical protein
MTVNEWADYYAGFCPHLVVLDGHLSRDYVAAAL